MTPSDLEEKIALHMGDRINRNHLSIETRRVLAQAALSVILEWFDIVEKMDHNPSRDLSPTTCAAPLASEQAGQYRKKPVVIEAIKLPDLFDITGRMAFEIWIGPGHKWSGDGAIIRTLEGDMRADQGDWIIKGLKGEFYPCKPDIFAATYDPATPLHPETGQASDAQRAGAPRDATPAELKAAFQSGDLDAGKGRA